MIYGTVNVAKLLFFCLLAAETYVYWQIHPRQYITDVSH